MGAESSAKYVERVVNFHRDIRFAGKSEACESDVATRERERERDLGGETVIVPSGSIETNLSKNKLEI